MSGECSKCGHDAWDECGYCAMKEALERTTCALEMVTVTEWHPTVPMPTAEAIRNSIRDSIIPQARAAISGRTGVSKET